MGAFIGYVLAISTSLVVFVAGVSISGATQAQAVPIAMPSVRVERAADTHPSVITHFQPFDVVATFSRPYCLSTDAPLYAAVILKQQVLSLTLSHIKTGPCVRERRLRVSGLPAAASDYRIRVSITDGTMVVPTFDAEVGEVDLKVVFTGSQSVISTARLDSGALNQYLGYQPSEAPVTLVLGSLNAPLGEHGVYIGPGASSVAFQAFSLPTLGSYISDAFQPLYRIDYPKPFFGRFVTTSLETARRLRSEWSPTEVGDPNIWVNVLRLTNGACPLGASPVYRLFNPTAVAHRWTQSMELYSVLAESGFVAEGAAFCAPKQD